MEYSVQSTDVTTYNIHAHYTYVIATCIKYTCINIYVRVYCELSYEIIGHEMNQDRYKL